MMKGEMNKPNAALKKWCHEQLGHYGEHEGKFWIESFVSLLWQKTNELIDKSCEHPVIPMGPEEACFYALKEIIRKFELTTNKWPNPEEGLRKDDRDFTFGFK